MWHRYLAGSITALALALCANAATRPRYGGVLRVELHEPELQVLPLVFPL